MSRNAILICLLAVLIAGSAATVFLLSTPGNTTRRLPDPPVLTNLSDLNSAAADLIQAKHQSALNKPYDPVARGELAMAYHANAIRDLARQTYRQTSILDPENAKWWYLLARLQQQNGEFEAAQSTMDRVLALDESYTPAHVRRGFWLLEQGRIDEAEASFTRATAIETDNRNGRIGLARIALQRDESSDALETLKTLRREQPTDGYIQYLLGMAYRQNGQIELARAELAVGAGKRMTWGRLDPWTEEMLSFQTSFRADYDLAKKYLTAGKPSEAIPLLRKMTQEFPDNLPVIISLAGAHSGMNRFEEAVVILQRGLEINPDHFALYLNLGSVYQRLNQLEPALKHTNEAIRLHPTLFNSHYQKAQILFVMGRLDEAIDSLKTTIEYDTTNQRAYTLLVVALSRLNRLDEAEDTLNRMINVFPGSPEPHFLLGGLYRDLGRIEEAREVINRAAKLFPNNQQVLVLKNSLSPQTTSPP